MWWNNKGKGSQGPWETFSAYKDVREWMISVYQPDAYKTSLGDRLVVPPPEAFVEWPPGPPGGPVPGVNCPVEPEASDAEQNAE